MNNTIRSGLFGKSVENSIPENLQSSNGDINRVAKEISEEDFFCSFSNGRENLLRWYPFKESDNVLEIGAEMGGLTAYLASVCASVVALESSKEKATTLSFRCSYFKNVQIVQSSFDEYYNPGIKFDYVLLVGALDHTGFNCNKQDFLFKTFNKAKSMLNLNGKLILAVENKYGIKYWRDVADDNASINFDSIDNYLKCCQKNDSYVESQRVMSFTKYDLEEMIHRAGFPKSKFFYLLHDYKHPMLALTDESKYADLSIVDLISYYSSELTFINNELKLYPEVSQRDAICFFSNFFIVEACNEVAEPCSITTVAMRRDYKSQYRLITLIQDNKVMYFAESKDSKKHLSDFFENTKTLVNRGIPCLSLQNSGKNCIFQKYSNSPRADIVFLSALRDSNVYLVKKMINRLVTYIKKSGELVSKEGELFLKEGFLNLTFRNSFWINDDLLFFDQEWKVNNVPYRYIIYRSVKYCLIDIETELRNTILNFFDFTETILQRFDEMEKKFFHSLTNEDTRRVLESRLFCDDSDVKIESNNNIITKQYQIELLLQNQRDFQKRKSEWKEKESQLLASLLEQEESYRRLQNELICREGECQQLRDKENNYLNELSSIKGSRSWLIAQCIRKTGRYFIPLGSKRALFLRLLWIVVRHPLIFFRNLSLNKIRKFVYLLKSNQIDDIRFLIKKATRIPSNTLQLNVALPEIVSDDVQTKKIDDYPILHVPHWDYPEVSIIIPVYNQFEYTYLCVKSILENSIDVSFEILIANDCSTDLTTEIEKIIIGVHCITTKKNLRFLLNCNNAAKYAKGKYLLFLNNDTQVQVNWLKPLVDLIESAEDIGMVGSKLVYPDGVLQEAGGILWQDGSAWNYGNGQNPSLPEFNYVKQVDYISGASIMIYRSLWEEIGGFDETFVPAYCEDSDLAFTVRKMGYRVMYQPQSVVIHFEGVSNGTDLSSGQKQYQKVNSKKFYKKWKNALLLHPQNGIDVFQARDCSFGKKTVLMIDHYVPEFDKDAGSRTIFQYIKLLANMGYNVKFIGDNFAATQPYTSILEQMGVEVLYGVKYMNNWKEWVRTNAEKIDIVFMNRPHISEKYIDFIKKETKAKIIYNLCDLHFLREEREYAVTGDEALRKSAIKWKQRELELARKADRVFSLSSDEKKILDQYIPGEKTVICPIFIYDNFVDKLPNRSNVKDLLFVGGFSHHPNVDAVQWFCAKVFPLIQKEIPEIKLHIVGSNPPEVIQKLQSNQIKLEGFVSDDKLLSFYQNCKVCVIPLRYGAGVKGKTIEAMYNGIPIVTTSIGIEGLPNIEDCITPYDDSECFAAEVVRTYLYGDDGRVQKCYDFVKNHYSLSAAKVFFSKEF